MTNLGRRLLSAFTATVFIGFALVVLRDVNSIGTAWRGVVLVVMAAATALTVTRTRWRLRQLRVIEAVAFVTVTLYLAATTYAVGVADPAAGAAAWTSTLLGFGLLMIAYGVFVLNTLARAVVGVVVIGAAPLAAALLVRANTADPGARSMPSRLAACSRPDSC